MKKSFFSIISLGILLGFIGTSAVLSPQEAAGTDQSKAAPGAIPDTVHVHGQVFKSTGGSDWTNEQGCFVLSEIDREMFSVAGFYSQLRCPVVKGKLRVAGYASMRFRPVIRWEGAVEVPYNPQHPVDLTLKKLF